MQYTVLTAVIKTSTLQILFKEELDFVAKHRFLFLEQQPEIIFAIANDAIIVKQLTTIRAMREQIERQEAEQKQQDVSGANLTSLHSHRSY